MTDTARWTKPEEIVENLLQVVFLVSQSQSVTNAIRSIGVAEVTYNQWRKEFGNPKFEQAKLLKDLETEKQRLRKAVADLTLHKLILREAIPGNYRAPRASMHASTTSRG